MNPKLYQEAVKNRSAGTIANIAITMLHQFDVMITGLIEAQKQNFINEGGIKEQMFRARLQQRDKGNSSSRSSQSTRSEKDNKS